MKRESGVVVRKTLLAALLGLSLGPIHVITFSPALAADPGAQAKAHAALAALPLNFEENLGQAGSTDVQYLAHGVAYSIALGQQGAVLSLAAIEDPGRKNQSTDPDQIRILLEGAQSSPTPHAEHALPGRINYLIGKDPSKWRTDLATYGKVRYGGVYPGVDLVYYGNQGHLEYDFVVAPGARPAAIGVRFEGAQKLELDAQGTLQIQSLGRQLAFEHPVAYQMDGARRTPVPASYRLAGETVRFKLGVYDHSKPLIIDPVLSYLSYLGGSGADIVGNGGIGNNVNPGQAAALDSAGNLYVTGSTSSANFPQTGGLAAPPAKYSAGTVFWAFVTKVSPDATSLVYSTYIGGSFSDTSNAIAVDSSGSAYITGNTSSSDFPVTAGAYQSVCNPAGNTSSGEYANCEGDPSAASGNWGSSAFVAKLNPSGNALAYATFLGRGTTGYAIAVDASGLAYVAGNSPGTLCAGAPTWNCFPTTAGALLADQRSGDDNTCAFLSVFNPTGSALVYSTLYGDQKQNGLSGDTHSVDPAYGTAVAVDPAGNFYLGGFSNSGFLPTTTGAYQSVSAPLDANGNLLANRGFLVKLSPVPASGTTPPTPIYATYVGGLGVTNVGAQNVSDFVTGIAVDAAGDAYVYGSTNDNGFPVTSGAYQTTCGLGGSLNCANAAFVAKLNPNGSSLLAATYFGDSTGSGDGIAAAGPIVLDSTGNVYIAGQASPLVAQVNPIQTTPNGPALAFAAKFDPGLSKLLFSTLIGNNAAGSTSAAGLAVDSSANIYLAGNVGGAGALSTTPGAFQAAFGGTSGGYGGTYGDGFVAKISAVGAGPVPSMDGGTDGAGGATDVSVDVPASGADAGLTTVADGGGAGSGTGGTGGATGSGSGGTGGVQGNADASPDSGSPGAKPASHSGCAFAVGSREMPAMASFRAWLLVLAALAMLRRRASR
ncbi:MAG: SBBP repeat-containing protein [Polyangia bacterium]|jgi:hypothetical protein